MPSSRGSSQPRDRTHISYVSCIGRWVLGTLAPSGRPYITHSMYKLRLPWWLSRQRIRLQFRRPGFNPWVRKSPLEQGMATHSSILAWEIPSTEDTGRLQSMRLQRFGHDLVTSPPPPRVNYTQYVKYKCINSYMIKYKIHKNQIYLHNTNTSKYIYCSI